MAKIIIINKTSLPDRDCLAYVKNVIADGRKPNKKPLRYTLRYHDTITVEATKKRNKEIYIVREDNNG